MIRVIGWAAAAVIAFGALTATAAHHTAPPPPAAPAVAVASASAPADVNAYTPQSWARTLLVLTGYPRTRCNVRAVIAWEHAEGGNWTDPAWRNPLNDTRPMPGSRLMHGHNPAHVRAYKTWRSGLDATRRTLTGPDYATIRAALHARDNAQAVADAVAHSPWGTEPFTATC